jgi:hypothetical protein
MQIAYLSADPKSIAYEPKSMSINSIMTRLCEFSLVVQEELISKFVNWSTAQKLDFLNAKVKRKDDDSDLRSPERTLFVLRRDYKR